ncbi:MAG TPA: nucleotidyltransferase family protein [Chloroflexota bacterium]|nr:nucleotidyltransferase family protein [Chloroflexota bacterium]
MAEHASVGENRRVYAVLACCAGQAGDDQLSRSLDGFTDWSALQTAAEAHGLGPLVYARLKAADVALPPAAWRALHGLYLRHRHANGVRLSALRQVLVALDAAGISPFVLKGAALAHLIYSEPGLRPMGDLDLLLKRSDLERARHVLLELGFEPSPPDDGTLPDKHVVVARCVDGLPVKVELHHGLFPSRCRITTTLDPLASSPVAFQIGDLTARTLGLEALLWHLCQHLVVHADVFTRLRLIWIADIARLAESFLDQIDWEHLRRAYPIVPRVLSLLHVVVPLSEDLLRAARVRVGHAGHGDWEDFRGWPRTAVADQRRVGKGTRRIVVDTFCPSAWWLRLHHGLGSASPLWWYRWVRHPLEILGWTTQLLCQRAIARPAGG